jgi:multicomponent Na+:H+ antiporter subunit B
MNRFAASAFAVAITAVLVFGIGHLPERGTPAAAPNRATSSIGSPNAANVYITEAYRDAHTPNIVTVTLADYRAFDTLGEVLVIFAAGVATSLILRGRRQE